MAGAETLGRALGGRKSGSGWMARCPAHEDGTPSLAIRGTADGRVLVRCHAGCDQQRVIAALRARGLWDDNGRRRLTRAEQPAAVEHRPNSDERQRAAAALAIWRCTRPAAGTLVEAYLQARGLELPPPPALRFHAGLKYPSGGIWPAMVALVTRGSDGTPLAVHRTFLARDGSGKAPVEPQKMMLGPCRGGAVRLGAPESGMMVGEGIETCLAAMQVTGRPAWAALSTSGLRCLALPVEVREIIVLADGDDPGEVAAREAARRWQREGRRVRIARPPRGLDFNDLLLDHVVRIQVEAP